LSTSQEMTQYDRMTKTPVSKLIFQLGIPTIISMLITNIYNTADTYFVSQISTSASGAIGVVFSLMAVIQAFGFMLGHGAGSSVSRLLGAKKAEEATVYTSTSFFLSLVFGLIIMILGLLFLTPFMYLLGSTDTILPYAKEYAVWILIAAPFMCASCVLNNILRYEGRSFYAMIGLTAGGLLNMIGDPILMFGCGLGVTGAGMSTAISQAVSFLILLWMPLSGKTSSKIRLTKIARRFREFWNIFTVGSPSLARQGLNSISTMILNHQAALYGDAAVAAMSIVGRVSFLIFAVGLGMGQGFQPVSAFNYGAKKYSRMRQGFFFTLISGGLMLAVLAVIGFFSAGPVVAWFRNDPEVIAVGVPALRYACIGVLFQPFAVCTNMLFQSIGKSGRAFFLAQLRNGVYFIPLILILPGMIGLAGIETAQPAADILACLTSVPFLVSFLKKLPPDGKDVL
jgi:putative MATE family efflux protein